MALFSILVDLAARTAGLETGVDRARRSIDRFANDARKAAKAIAAAFALDKVKDAFVANIKETLQFADTISNAATQAGIATEEFSKLAFAVEQSGGKAEDLSSAISKLQVKLSDAANGSEEAQQSFRQIGLSAERLRALDVQGQFEAIADAVNRLREQSDKAAATKDIFGGTELLRLFSGGAAAIQDATEKAQRFNNVLSSESAEKIKKANDTLTDLKALFRGISLEILNGAAPAIEAFAAKLDRVRNGGFASDLDKRLDEISVRRGELIEEFDRLQKRGPERRGRGEFAQDFALNDIKKVQAELRKLEIERIETEKKIRDRRQQAQQVASGPTKLIPKGEFTGAELAEALRRRKRSQDAIFEANRERAENEAAILNELDRNLAEQQERIFEENSAAIAEVLDRNIEETAQALEIQESLFDQLSDTIERSLSDVFLNAGQGASDFADSVINAFKRILADAAAAKLTSLLGSLFTSKTGAAGGGGFGAFIGSLFGGKRERGGPVSAGKAFLVGERGPELFAPGMSGRIIPNGAANGGSMSVSISNTIVMQPGMNQAAFAKQVSDQTVARIKDEQKRGKLRL